MKEVRKNVKLEWHLAELHTLPYEVSTFIFILAFNPRNAQNHFII